jgi:hypothetical protein
LAGKEEIHMRFHLTGARDPFLSIMAVVLFLTGAVMLFTELSAGLAFAFIAIGGALTAISLKHRRDDRTSH